MQLSGVNVLILSSVPVAGTLAAQLACRLGIRYRVRVSIFGVRDSISSILSLRCYSTAGTRYLVARVPVTGTVDRT